MSHGPNVRDRLKYWFDNYMSKGGRSAFLGLMTVFAIFLVAILIFRMILALLLPEQDLITGRGPLRDALLSFVQVFDPGSIESDIDSSRWIVLAAFIAGLGGVFMVSILIAFLTNALDTRLSRLRRGHSRVIESDHTLILGWEEQRVVEIIRELVLANESERKRAVVVLADQDKEYMDDFLGLQLPNTKTTRVVTRSGSPASAVNLRIVSSRLARSAILLAGCSDAATDREKAESDAKVIKTLLALEGEQPESYSINVAAELFSHEARALSRSIGIKALGALDTILLLARVLVQTSRSVGLSVVYHEVMSFEGSELYLADGTWDGFSFRDVAFGFSETVPIGIKYVGGDLALNPPPETILSKGDQLVVLAEDDSTIQFEPTAKAPAIRFTVPDTRAMPQDEKQLLIGCGVKTQIVLEEFATYVSEGSSVDIIPRTPDHANLTAGDLNVTFLPVNPLDPATWESINPLDYDHIILISEGQRDSSPDAIDAETIMILLLLRAAIERESPNGESTPTVVTELLDSDNRVVAAKTGVHDFVVSNRIVSMLLAQISEEPTMLPVYRTLLTARGSEIYLKAANLYASAFPAELSFAEIRVLAFERGEICIGVKIRAEESDPVFNYGVHLTPHPNETFVLEAGDALVVVAEDDT